MDLRHWVNEGLMTFFFLVVGLEAKRELDTGELRERQRLAIPVFASLGGMAVPILIFTAFNAGGSGAHAWGAAMSTDTALALGVLGLLAPRGTRLRLRVLTIAVVDDLVALIIIATVYTDHVDFFPLALGGRLLRATARSALRAAAPGGTRRRSSSASRSGWRCSSRGSIRWSPASRWASSPPPTRRSAAISSA